MDSDRVERASPPACIFLLLGNIMAYCDANAEEEEKQRHGYSLLEVMMVLSASLVKLLARRRLSVGQASPWFVSACTRSRARNAAPEGSR